MVEINDGDSQFSSFEGDSHKPKKYRAPKPYVQRLKRHKDAILSLYAMTGEDGPLLISGSADETIRIWDLKSKTVTPLINVERPLDPVLIRFQAIGPDNLPRFPDGQSANHLTADDREDTNNPLAGLQPKKQHIFVTCFQYAGTFVFLAYEDGLIACWDLTTKRFLYPMIGHTNRVNALESV